MTIPASNALTSSSQKKIFVYNLIKASTYHYVNCYPNEPHWEMRSLKICGETLIEHKVKYLLVQLRVPKQPDQSEI